MFDFIDRCGDGPFFVWYAPMMPHSPHNPPDRLLARRDLHERRVAGQLAPATEFNMLRQSFTVTGSTLLAISEQPTSQTAVTGTTANFSVTASGTSTLSYQWRKDGVDISGQQHASL